MELPRGYKHSYGYCAYCPTTGHDIEDSNVYGKEGVCFLILCPSYHVSHLTIVGDSAHMEPVSSQLVYASSSFGTKPLTLPTLPSMIGRQLSALR